MLGLHQRPLHSFVTLVSFLAFSISPSLAAPAAASYDGTALQVKTSTGAFRGYIVYSAPFPQLDDNLLPAHLKQSRNAPVRQWLGIPYAATTAGNNRFQPPKTRTPASGVQFATSFGHSCPQKLGKQVQQIKQLLHQTVESTEGEDCLSVNIWAPYGKRATGKAAVIVWFYGGAFQFGASSDILYHGDRWVAAQDDVIIVSVNYRMSVFGFPLSPQLRVSNRGSINLGLLDARAAIDWIQDNIAGFGGDPNRIILSGQSAGGTIADVYTFAYPRDKRIKGVIAMSGGASFLLVNDYPNPQYDLSALTSPWNVLAAGLGCGLVPNSQQLKCMQTLPYDRIINAAVLDFKPVADNATFSGDYNGLLDGGDFAHVPLFATSTADEGGVFAAVVSNSTTDNIPYWTRDSPELELGSKSLWCAAYRSAEARRAAGTRAWQATYHGNFANISPANLKSYHGSDIGLAFGTYDVAVLPNIASTPQEAALSLFMQNAFTAFARDPANGLVHLGFSVPSGSQPNLSYDIGVNNMPAASPENASEQAAFWCANLKWPLPYR